MTPDKRTKRKAFTKDYRISVNFDDRVGQLLRSDSERKGVGVVDVIRIAVSEYFERRVALRSAESKGAA